MAKELKNFAAAPNAGEVDLTKAQVENVAEPTQGSTNKSPDDTAVSDEEAAYTTSEQVQASTEATDGDSEAPTAGKGKDATANTTENVNAVQGDENTSAEQDSQAQAEKAEKLKLIEVEDQQVRDNLKARLSENGIEAQVVLKYDLKKLLAAAIILLTYAGNRKVDEKHVNRLVHALKQDGKKRFSEPITICPAKPALMLGTKLNDDDGNAVTLDHPDIDLMFVVLDGQHRLAAIKGSDFEYEADVVIISAPEDINEYVRVINAYDSNWDMIAIRNQNEVISGVEDKLKVKEQEAEKILPKTSTKYRDYGLTGEKDAVKKKDLLKGTVPVCDEEKANRGIGIFKSTRLLNPDCKKNGLLTMSWLIEVFKAKEEYNKNKGDVDFIKHLKLFMYQESQKGLDMTDKAVVGTFIQEFAKNFKAFVKKNPLTTASDEQLKTIDEKIQSIIAAGVSSTGKVYEHGSVSDVVTKMKERKANQAKLDEAKAKMDEAIKAAKKEYQDFKKKA
ncbi:MAG: hypothetical protein IKH25_12320 [Muribaculaceae bacterium]|nr:hypothetical protein [Muribaculaceae bacterium]